MLLSDPSGVLRWHAVSSQPMGAVTPLYQAQFDFQTPMVASISAPVVFHYACFLILLFKTLKPLLMIVPNFFPNHFYSGFSMYRVYEIEIQLVCKILKIYFLDFVTQGRPFGQGIISYLFDICKH